MSPRQGEAVTYDLVGPPGETGDFLGKDRDLVLEEGDLVVCSVGAYGFAMSSNYNTRSRAAEVMVDGDKTHLVRQRGRAIDSLWELENILPSNFGCYALPFSAAWFGYDFMVVIVLLKIFSFSDLIRCLTLYPAGFDQLSG